MNTEFPIYVKSGNEIIEVCEDSWISILKELDQKRNSYRYAVHRRFDRVADSDHWETSWIHKPEYQSTKEEFDALKFEFLNWVDQNLER